MTAACTLAAAAAHNRRPIARCSDLDEHGAFAQTLTDNAQGGLGDTQMAARPLACSLGHPVQVDAWRCVAQRMRERIEADRPSGANKGLGLDGTSVRGDEKSRALHSAALHSNIKAVAAREPPLT